MTTPAKRVRYTWMLVSGLAGPSAVLVIYFAIVSAFSLAPVTDEDRSLLILYCVIITVVTSPLTVGAGSLGATLALHVAGRKRQAWSRLRWTATAALLGPGLVVAMTAIYMLSVGARIPSGQTSAGDQPFFAIALPLLGSGALVGALAAWISYADLESPRA